MPTKKVTFEYKSERNKGERHVYICGRVLCTEEEARVTMQRWECSWKNKMVKMSGAEGARNDGRH